MKMNENQPKPWLYVQSTGALYRPDGSWCSNGYAGHGDGRNNPVMQEVSNVGPLPVGLYKLGEVTESKGPFTIRLEPDQGNQMHGRSGFLIHGDTQAHDASHGCIILDRITRVALSGEAQRGGWIRVIDRPRPTDLPAKVT